jgi:hypothetical protein
VAVRQGLRHIEGLALEVADDGALLLETARGEVVRVTSGEITLESAGIPPAPEEARPEGEDGKDLSAALSLARREPGRSG